MFPGVDRVSPNQIRRLEPSPQLTTTRQLQRGLMPGPYRVLGVMPEFASCFPSHGWKSVPTPTHRTAGVPECTSRDIERSILQSADFSGNTGRRFAQRYFTRVGRITTGSPAH